MQEVLAWPVKRGGSPRRRRNRAAAPMAIPILAPVDKPLFMGLMAAVMPCWPGTVIPPGVI
jgi:hypothetical protein